MKRLQLVLFLAALGKPSSLFAQVYLFADGVSDTYTLINSVLGGTAEEVPDCSHPDFGPHITQAFDSELGTYAFVFSIHGSAMKSKRTVRRRHISRGSSAIRSPSGGDLGWREAFNPLPASPISTRSKLAMATMRRQF